MPVLARRCVVRVSGRCRPRREEDVPRFASSRLVFCLKPISLQGALLRDNPAIADRIASAPCFTPCPASSDESTVYRPAPFAPLCRTSLTSFSIFRLSSPIRVPERGSDPRPLPRVGVAFDVRAYGPAACCPGKPFRGRLQCRHRPAFWARPKICVTEAFRSSRSRSCVLTARWLCWFLGGAQGGARSVCSGASIVLRSLQNARSQCSSSDSCALLAAYFRGWGGGGVGAGCVYYAANGSVRRRP